MQARLLLAAAGWCVLSSLSARAGAADESPPPADAEAQQAYERADAFYRARDLPAAHREMEQSYRLSQRPDLLYNLARIEDELGQCPAARGHYQQYLKQAPDGEARKDAEQADARLASRCDNGAAARVAAPVAKTAPVAPAPLPAPEATSARTVTPARTTSLGSTQRWLGWSMVAGGAAAGLGAAYFLDAAIDARDALQGSVDRQVAGGPHYDPGLRAEQHRHQRAARALGVAGAALLVGGAVVVLLAPTESGSERRASVHVNPGLLAATYTQAF